MRRSKLYYLRGKVGKAASKVKRKTFSKKLLNNSLIKQGCFAESIACAFLTKNNYQILCAKSCLQKS